MSFTQIKAQIARFPYRHKQLSASQMQLQAFSRLEKTLQRLPQTGDHRDRLERSVRRCRRCSQAKSVIVANEILEKE